MRNNGHNKKKEVKALIIRNILIREFSGLDLEKSEIEEVLEHHGISIPNFEFHLYSRKKHKEGLIPKGVIKSKNGNLIPNLKTLRSIATIVEYMENDPDYGERISYLLDRAFKEAFYSEYGDMLINEWRLYRLLDKELDKLQEKYKFGDHIHLEAHYELYNRIFSIRLFEPGQTLHVLPQDIVEGLLKGIDAVLSEFDLLGLLVEFAGSLRGDPSPEFKIAYIIKALEISEWVRELETKKDERYKLLELADVSLLFHDNDDVMDLSNIREGIFRMFVERIIRKALNENVSMDRSLKTNDSVLELFSSAGLQIANSSIRKKVSGLLNHSLFTDPESMEAKAIIKRREELGFKSNFLLV